METKTLNYVKILECVAEVFFEDGGEWYGSNIVGLLRLHKNRRAEARITVRNDLVTITVFVPGNSAMTTTFSLFGVDATESRVKRYANFYANGLHLHNRN